MAFVHHLTRRGRLRALPLDLHPPLADFLLAAILFAPGVVALGLLLPGGGAATAAAALLAHAGGTALAARAMQHHYPHDDVGACNLVTLGRLALTASLLAPLLSGSGASWAVFAVAAIALSLDGVDGWFARRQGLASGFGARFDMEVDAALALLLALNAAAGGHGGALVLLLGLPRYAFALAGLVLPWMRRDLPERFSRKVVCVLQLGALIALQAPILPAALASALVPLVAAALVWSFARDLHWLWRKRT